MAKGAMCELHPISPINPYKVHSNQLHSAHCVPNVNYCGITTVMSATLSAGRMSQQKSMLQVIHGFRCKIQITNEAF